MQCLVEETQNSLNSKCELSTGSETGSKLPCGYSMSFPTPLIFSFIFYDSFIMVLALAKIVHYLHCSNTCRLAHISGIFSCSSSSLCGTFQFSLKLIFLLLAQCFFYDSNSNYFLIFSIITSTFFLVRFFKI